MFLLRHLMAAAGLVLAASAAGAQHNERSIPLGGSGAVQAGRTVRLLPGVQAGGVLPTSDLADFYNTGLRVGATLTAIVPTQPYGIRLALTYDRLSGGSVTPAGQPPVEVDAGSVVSLSVTGLISERAERNALLYLIAGAGVHRLDASGPDSLGSDDEPTDVPDDIVDTGGAETKFGASVGGGITFRLGGLPSYLEVQIVKLFGADAVLVPLVVGVQLGR
jgi:opacity protein-like surface antigen